MKFKDIKFELKQIGETGNFQGYAAAFGNVDLGGDVLMAGAFKKTISGDSSRPLLWAHNLQEPIGITTVGEDAKGLAVDGQLNLDVQRAREIHSLMKQGAVKGMSFGFDPVRRSYKNGVRELQEVKLYEVSLVPVAMNPEAQVLSVKSADDFEDLLQAILSYKGIDPLSLDTKGLIEQVETRLSSLRAAQAPGADMHDKDAPEILHPSLDRISQLLRS